MTNGPITVVITGAGQGVGRNHAVEFGRAGSRVVVNDIVRPDGTSSADLVVDEIRSAGGEAIAAKGAIDDPRTGDAIVEAALQEFGRVDVIVNNAGILRDRSFQKMSVGDWEDVRRVHLDGAFHLTRAAWPHLREQRFGRVIVTTSISGLFGQFGQANYSAAKLGLVGLVNTLALEGAKYGITANAISPLASTAMNAAILSADEKQRLQQGYVSAAVRFLASPECEVTGTILHAGGGYYSRVAIAHSQGLRFSHVPTVEELAEKWPSIDEGPWVLDPIAP